MVWYGSCTHQWHDGSGKYVKAHDVACANPGTRPWTPTGQGSGVRGQGSGVRGQGQGSSSLATDLGQGQGQDQEQGPVFTSSYQRW